ncbi:MAG: glucose 1-dehydrogenase [Steroidobacteraceae bacterium]
MRALTVVPGQSHSACVADVPEPAADQGTVLARTLAVGICGTDREILAGRYGQPAPGKTHLILGHESLAEVEDAPPDSGFARGDLIAGIVRHPDPVPCDACRAGEWDMCRNGLYTEHGIKGLNGFCAERWRIAPQFAVLLEPALRSTGVLVEPTSVVAKAWDQIERIGRRSSSWRPQCVLVTGAGPIGLLASLLAQQRGCVLHVYDRDRGDTKRRLVEQLGGRYHCDAVQDALDVRPDVIIECTGAAEVILAAIGTNGAGGIVCLAGLSSGVHRISFDFTKLNRSMVLGNDVVFGTVNANRRHYELAASALSQADPQWLQALISRRVSLDRWTEAMARRAGDVKVVLDFAP